MAYETTDDRCDADGDIKETMTSTQRAFSEQDTDTFYSEANMRHLQKVIKDYEEGKTQLVEHELIEVEEE